MELFFGIRNWIPHKDRLADKKKSLNCWNFTWDFFFQRKLTQCIILQLFYMLLISQALIRKNELHCVQLDSWSSSKTSKKLVGLWIIFMSNSCFFSVLFVFFEWNSNSFQTEIVVITVCRRTSNEYILENENTLQKNKGRKESTWYCKDPATKTDLWSKWSIVYVYRLGFFFCFLFTIFFLPKSMRTIV